MTTEGYVKSRRNLNFINMGFIVVSIPLVSILCLTMKGHSPNVMILAMLSGVSLFIALEMIVLTIFVMRKMRKIGYLVDDTGISRLDKHGASAELIEYGALDNVKIVTLQNDAIRVIKIKYGRKRLTMIGLDGMDHIAASLRESDARKVISEKFSKVDWYSCKTGVVSLIIIVPIMILLLFFNETIAACVSDITLIGFGLYMLIFKPMTNYYGKKWRIFEVILSLIIIGAKIVDHAI
jgi:hypothetical protein